MPTAAPKVRRRCWPICSRMAGSATAPRTRLAAVDFLGAKASLLIAGGEGKKAVGGNPAGHPKRLLAWLAGHAASRGKPLKKGDIVTTGSHTGITIAPLGARVTARFEGLGEAVLWGARVNHFLNRRCRHI